MCVKQNMFDKVFNL